MTRWSEILWQIALSPHKVRKTLTLEATKSTRLPSEKTLAERKRDLLRVERHNTLQLLLSHERGRETLQSSSNMLPQGMSPLEAVATSLDGLFQGALKAASEVRGPRVVRDAQKVAVSFVPSDEIAATTEIFPDNSGLIYISDAILSTSWRFARLNTLWRSSHPSVLRRAQHSPEEEARKPTLMAGTAAIRYSMLHQRVWGMSASVEPSATQYFSMDALYSVLFVILHEIGHFVLGHDPRNEARSSSVTVQWEYEADAFALEALRGYLGSMLSLHAIGTAIVETFSMLEVWERGSFIRVPNTHPTTTQRWHSLRNSFGPAATDVERKSFGIRVMAGNAAAEHQSLPSECWEALRRHPEIETDYHGEPYIRLIEGFDRTIDMPHSRRNEIAEDLAGGSQKFMEGWHKLGTHGYATAFATWEIAEIDRVLDPSVPLGFNELVTKIVEAPIWGDTSDPFRRTLALMAIHFDIHKLKNGAE